MSLGTSGARARRRGQRGKLVELRAPTHVGAPTDSEDTVRVNHEEPTAIGMEIVIYRGTFVLQHDVSQ